MRNRLTWIAVLACFLPGVSAGERITLDRPALYDLQFAGFELTKETDILVEAVGLWDSDRSSWIRRIWNGADDQPMSVFAWMIDADTRQPVWAMETGETDRESKTLRRAERSLTLGPGRYELYLFAGYGAADARSREAENARDAEDWWRRMFDDRRSLEDLTDDLEQCYVSVSGQDLRKFEVTGAIEGSLIRQAGVGDSQLDSSGFALSRPMTLRVYTLFELGKDSRSSADYGWIVDAETREVVWEPRRRRAENAGGGEKNQRIDREIELPAGRYVVYYGSDDSHSLDGFNVNAPHDPLNWGITLLAGEGFEAAAFSTFDPEPRRDALIDFSEAGSDVLRVQAFELDEQTSIYIYALGEFDHDDDQFYDYGWIIDHGTGETVWQMTGDNTRGAGGSDKNRMFDGFITLAAGRYVAHYVSDGSHASGDWNSARPFDAQAWGMRIEPGRGVDVASVRLLDDEQLARSDDYLVRIAYVGDDERVRREFTLDRPATVEIRAVGEGSSGSMHDYGFLLENDSGRVVWEMDYDDTRHAGGADKNRMVTRRVQLDPGAYEAVYVSDGSHSFRGWNAEGPRDPTGWGLTVRRIDP